MQTRRTLVSRRITCTLSLVAHLHRRPHIANPTFIFLSLHATPFIAARLRPLKDKRRTRPP